jgi:hypothetical protein
VPEPIYPVGRREDGVRGVPPISRQRLLAPAEREEARRKRDERRRATERTHERPAERSPQDRSEGVDYSA